MPPINKVFLVLDAGHVHRPAFVATTQFDIRKSICSCAARLMLAPARSFGNYNLDSATVRPACTRKFRHCADVPEQEPATQVVKNIRRATWRHFSAEDKIRAVLEGLRGADSIAELYRREGIVQNLYYPWSKDFPEAGKKRLAGDTGRAATSDEVRDLRREASALKEVVGRGHAGMALSA
jgi:transposase